MSLVRVLLADDQAMVRAGFKMILDLEDDIHVVGEVADGEAAVRLADQLRPDVIIMDVRMPKLDGIEATRRILTDDDTKGPHIVIVTTFDDDETLAAALRSGACGFLLKNAPPETLVDAVRTAAAGEGLLSPTVTRRVIAQFTQHAATIPPHAALRLQALTQRERDVLDLIAHGYTNREIAERLHVSHGTIKTHVGRILAKLRLRDRVAVVVFAHQCGLLAHNRDRD